MVGYSLLLSIFLYYGEAGVKDAHEASKHGVDG